MTWRKVHATDKRQLLHLMAVDCYTLQTAAEEMRLPYDVALDVASHHGYPNVDRMLRAIDALQSIIDQEGVVIPTPAPPPVTRHVTTPPKEEVMATPEPDVGKEEDEPQFDGMDEDLEVVPVLLLEARKSDRKRVVNTAARVQTDIDWLREQVIADRSERRNAEEIERLERRLAALRGKPYVDGKERSRGASVIPEVTCQQVAPPEFEGCPFPVTTSLQGLNTHRRRAHNLPALSREQVESLVAFQQEKGES